MLALRHLIVPRQTLCCACSSSQLQKWQVMPGEGLPAAQLRATALRPPPTPTPTPHPPTHTHTHTRVAADKLGGASHADVSTQVQWVLWRCRGPGGGRGGAGAGAGVGAGAATGRVIGAVTAGCARAGARLGRPADRCQGGGRGRLRTEALLRGARLVQAGQDGVVHADEGAGGVRGLSDGRKVADLVAAVAVCACWGVGVGLETLDEGR